MSSGRAGPILNGSWLYRRRFVDGFGYLESVAVRIRDNKVTQAPRLHLGMLPDGNARPLESLVYAIEVVYHEVRVR
jgi:hypothetical protein